MPPAIARRSRQRRSVEILSDRIGIFDRSANPSGAQRTRFAQDGSRDGGTQRDFLVACFLGLALISRAKYH